MRELGMKFVLFTLVSTLIFGFGCGGDDEESNNGDQIGKSCQSNEDCGGSSLCNADSLCVACQSCDVRADCPEGNICNQDIHCCIQVECSEDEDCEEPKYCMEYTCREKSCMEEAECSRANHHCLANEEGDMFCANPGCLDHTDCDTKLCNLETHVCEKCHSDSDCPDAQLKCQEGYCTLNGEADGDGGDHVKLGCDLFQSNCLMEQFTCFDKINPPASYASCSKYGDPDVENGATMYRFIFSDGQSWMTHVDETPWTYEAYGLKGFCYHIEPNVENEFLEYKTMEGELLGRYRLDELLNEVVIQCPDESFEYYNLTNLRDEECFGFVEGGVYNGSVTECEWSN